MANPPAVAPPFASITSLTISFGDGTSQPLPLTGTTGPVSGIVQHAYALPGTYVATLSASASNGASNTTTASVAVGGQCGPPSVTVTAAPQSAAAGQVVTFNFSAVAGSGCTSAPLPTMLINFGDGSSPLPLNGPSGTITHTYDTPGVYTATVTATSGGQTGVGQTSVTVTGSGQPVAISVSATPSSVSAGQPVTISYTASAGVGIGFPSIQSMLISFGDGTAPLPLMPPSGSIARTYTASGTYTITVTATDNSGQQGQGTAIVLVGGQCAPPSVSVTAAPSSAAVGQPISFSYSAVAGAGCSQTTAPLPTMLINFGDGSGPLPLNPPSGTTSRAYSSPGVYTVIVTAATGGQTGQGAATVTITPAAQAPVATLTASPNPVPAGQSVNFVGSVVSAAPGSVTTSATIAFGDGQVQTPQATGAGLIAQHIYASPGSYTAILSVTDTTGQTGQAQTVISVTVPTPPAAPGVSVTYPAGWNLISVPTGSMVPSPLGPLYTFQTGDTAYQVVQSTQPGLGYWAYFPTPATASLPLAGGPPQVITKALPAGQFIMVGNPGSAAAILSGADVVYAYDPVAGYQQTNQIPPGAGAWVFSYNGGTLTITSGIR